MTQTATVEAVLGDGRVRIAVARQTSCGHDCENCAGCGAQAGTVRAVALDPLGVSAGDRVEVASDNRRIIGIAAVVYLVPFAAFFLGCGLGACTSSGALHAAVSALVTAAGCVPALLWDRRSRRQGGVRFTIQRKL